MGVKISELPLNTNPTLSSAVIPMVDGGVTYRVTLYDVVVPSLSALDLKEPIQTPATQPEAEAGTSTELRSWSPERVKQAIEAKNEVITVADAAARKNPASYASVYVGLRVVQTDQVVVGYPSIEWSLAATDVTADASWFSRVLTNPETGELVADLRLADFTGIVPPLNSIGQIDGKIRVGDGAATGGNVPVDIPTSPATLTLIADASDVVKGYGITTIPEDWKSSQTTLKGLSIGQGVTTIGNNAFYSCSGLTGSLTIPNSVTSIGNSAFKYCTGFTGSLTIGNSVTTIGSYAFYYCTGLTGSLTIPNSVTSIGSYAFNSCSGLTGSLTIPNSVTTIGSYAFYSCSGLTGSLTIPNSVTTIGNNAFRSCSSFTGSLTIPNSVTSIGNYAFYFCSSFTGSLTIPNSVTSIGNYAFFSCSGLTNVNCYVTKTIFDQSNVIGSTSVTTIHARSSDVTWTASGGQTIGGKTGITVVKDLV